MKRIVIIVVIVLVGVGGLAYFGLKDGGQAPRADIAQEKSTQLNFEDISKEVAGGKAYLVDVRTAAEFQQGHFGGAVLHDLGDIQSGRLPEISEDKRLYVYCRSGNRSAQAAALLKKAGYTDIIDLGGLSDVQRIGGKITQ